MMTPISLGAMVLAGLGAGEAVLRLRQRMPTIMDGNVYPGATLQALLSGGVRAVCWGAATRVSVLTIWGACAIAPLAPAGAVALACFLTLLLAGALVDFDAQILPDEVTGSLVWGGMIVHMAGAAPWGGSIEGATLGVVVAYGAVWLISAGYCVSRGMSAIGHGDLKLLAGLGAWLGAGALPAILLISCSVQVVAQLIMRRRGVMAFGPALAAAGGLLAILKAAGVAIPILLVQ
ncbi:MAG: prepilin peptidase [Achromobacter sp.]|uniref:prepilin peptidase n=1 Tax=Achromobacter sp. TaxID=134375 RepID=UPI0012D0E2FA|nr:A24 family peptidase [Achromobacter sp.]MPS81657.1 prepilin peptidase [Achromobacter sp.]